MIDLSGQRVLVTGGSRGIGAACCRLFAGVGAAVGVHYHRDQAAAEAVLAECGALNDQPHLLLQGQTPESACTRHAFIRFTCTFRKRPFTLTSIKTRSRWVLRSFCKLVTAVEE